MTIITLGAASLIAVGLNGEKNQKVENVKEKALDARSFDGSFVDFMNSNVIPRITYNVDSRYIAKITKSDLRAAQTIGEIFPEGVIREQDVITENRIVHLLGEVNMEEAGKGSKLNQNQLQLIKRLDYSSDFYIEAYDREANGYTEKKIYYISVVPETQATYQNGLDDLLEYLRIETTEEVADVQQSNLKPGQISFLISEKGEVTSAESISSSGYQKFDEKMLLLIKDLPRRWKPAKDSAGNPISQKMTLFFGIQGC